MSQREKMDSIQHREFYEIRSLMGNTWAMFFVLLGGREAGKTYGVLDMFLRDWKKNGTPYWHLRLSEVSTKKMLKNNAEKAIDADLVRKYGLELSVKGPNVYDHGKKMAEVVSLSSMAKDKGVAMFDKDFLQFHKHYNILIDEFQREPNERNTFSVIRNLVNQLENIARSTKERIRVIFSANTLEEASDVLVAFNFIPEQFGIFKIRKKRCVMHNIEPTEAYKARRRGSIADLLTPKDSNFTNKIDVDKSLVYKGRLIRPISIIKFTKEKEGWFTVWNNRIICRYHGECVPAIPMLPYLDEVFDIQQRNTIYDQFNARYLYFRDLITQKMFQKELEKIKPKG